uniref:Uncharacterized protein n=1 Tax=Timema tahoe TaxID=61484 RepID=A0A7R9INP4_9NEOP|nr:unnamed protein product [Timema tahoe]
MDHLKLSEELSNLNYSSKHLEAVPGEDHTYILKATGSEGRTRWSKTAAAASNIIAEVTAGLLKKSFIFTRCQISSLSVAKSPPSQFCREVVCWTLDLHVSLLDPLDKLEIHKWVRACERSVDAQTFLKGVAEYGELSTTRRNILEVCRHVL